LERDDEDIPTKNFGDRFVLPELAQKSQFVKKTGEKIH